MVQTQFCPLYDTNNNESRAQPPLGIESSTSTPVTNSGSSPELRLVKYQDKSFRLLDSNLILLFLLAACLARGAEAKHTHDKELAACLAREAEAKETHKKELAACKEQKAEAEKAHEEQLAFKDDQTSEIVSRYQLLHATHEKVCAGLPDDDLVRNLKSEIARLKNANQLQVSFYSFLPGACDVRLAASPNKGEGTLTKIPI